MEVGGNVSLCDPIEAIGTTSNQYLILLLFWLLSPPFLLSHGAVTDRLDLLRLGQDGWAGYSASSPTRFVARSSLALAYRRGDSRALDVDPVDVDPLWARRSSTPWEVDASTSERMDGQGGVLVCFEVPPPPPRTVWEGTLFRRGLPGDIIEVEAPLSILAAGIGHEWPQCLLRWK